MSDKIKLDVTVSKAEHNVILGALAMYQVGVLGSHLDPEEQKKLFDKRGRRKQNHAAPQAREIYYEIVRDGLPSTTPDLGVSEIDDLCQRLNGPHFLADPEPSRFLCSHCGATGPAEALHPLNGDDLRTLARHYVGQPVPAGKCPACGTWCDEEKEGE
jgi:hypothetical protein